MAKRSASGRTSRDVAKRSAKKPEVCGQCKKPRVPDDIASVLDEECLSHDVCEKCAAWCYAYNDQDCEHGAVYRMLADLRAELAAAKRDGVMTENLRDLASAIGAASDATADEVAQTAAEEIRRLGQAVVAYAAAAEE